MAHSSKWMKLKGDEFKNFYWQDGYGGFSVSSSEIQALKTYIDNQHEHHKTVTYQGEYRWPGKCVTLELAFKAINGLMYYSRPNQLFSLIPGGKLTWGDALLWFVKNNVQPFFFFVKGTTFKFLAVTNSR